MVNSFSDIDPLDTSNLDQGDVDDLYKSQVRGIVKSYIDQFDVFSEIIQNSLDAVELKVKEQSNFEPKLWITIDLKDQMLTVVDNGTGLKEEEFTKFLTPSITMNKKRGVSRGNKGVGATYLAYGFSFLKAQTKNDNSKIAFEFKGARSWVESTTSAVARPKTQEVTYKVDELNSEKSGTSITIGFNNHDKEVPRDLSWIGLKDPESWYQALRLKTPLGYVNIDRQKQDLPEVEIKIISKQGVEKTKTFSDPEYFYLYESPNLKTADLIDIDNERKRQKGTFTIKNVKAKYRDLECVYRLWDSKEILKKQGDFKDIANDEENRKLIKEHEICVFFTFFWSTEAWTTINETNIGLRKNYRIVKGGLQLATDWMPTGRQSPIPITRNLHYQEQAHVLVHFRDGQPDLGRKTFSDELEKLSQEIAKRCIYFYVGEKYKEHMRPASGARKSAIQGVNLFSSQQKALQNFSDNPLNLPKQFAMIAEPSDEQDVVALFHEMLRKDYIEGYLILTTSQIDIYDCLFRTDFKTSHVFDKNKNPLGVASGQTNFPNPHATPPRVMEFKYSLNGIIEDIRNREKDPQEIDLVVCWELGDKIFEDYIVNSLYLEEEGSLRNFYMSTHNVISKDSQIIDFEIICLKDLVLYFRKKRKDLKKRHENLVNRNS